MASGTALIEATNGGGATPSKMRDKLHVAGRTALLDLDDAWPA